MANSSANWRALPIFLFLCLLVFGFGGFFQPGDWYEQLNRAPWSPPNIAFPIVWSILYVFIAIAGWKIFAASNNIIKWLWGLQLALNALWSWIFFGQHWLTVGLIDIILIDLIVINLVLQARRQGLISATLLLCPYVAWLLLATSLNAYIVFANS